MKLKTVMTYAPEQGRPGRWVIRFESGRGRWAEVNLAHDIKPEELDELFVETQATVADRQAALADQLADTNPAGPPPVKE